MTRTERLLRILQMLREKRRPVTAAAIGEHFGVSERTIYRDIATLTSQGAMIAGEAGVGFVLRDDFFLPPLAFDPHEAAALMLGLRFVLRRGGVGLSAAAKSAQAKLSGAMPARFDDAAARRSAFVVAPHPAVRGQILEIIREAIDRARKARIRYERPDGTISERIVWPIVIGWFDGFEMFAAWCELRQEFRHFRVDRLACIELLDQDAGRLRHALLQDYRRLEPDVEL